RSSAAVRTLPIVTSLRKTTSGISADCAPVVRICRRTDERSDCHRSNLGKDRRIDRCRLSDEAFKRVPFLIKSSSSPSHLKPECRAYNEPAKSLAKLFHVATADNKAGLAITNRLPNTTDVRRNYRQTGPHRFEDGTRKTFPFRGKYE